MVKKGINKVLALVSGLLCSIIVPAQELPLLSPDPAVRMERFPNGMSCYVVANPHVKGYADYAIIRRSDRQEILRWNNCHTSDPTHTDSTLLAIVREVAESGVPADHAVFACGDLDAASVLNKVRYMSLMVPAGAPAPARNVEYPEGSLSEVSFSVVADSLKGTSKVLAEWTSPRTPEELMNTIQKAIYDKAVYELGHIVCERMDEKLSSADISACDVAWFHRGSLDGPDEEYFRLSVEVGPHAASMVMQMMKEVLGSIDSYGATISELHLAEDAYLSELSIKSEYLSNKDYMNMCISSYVYNSSPISPGALVDFHQSKDIPDELRQSVFASITSALLDVEDGDYPMYAERHMNLIDTLALPSQPYKTALRSFRKDPVSGGVLWTFFNGFRVVYKQMPTGGLTYYSLAVNGGYGRVKDYETDGEAYLSEYLDKCYISGMEPDYFKSMMQLAGVTMHAELNFSNIIVSGEVKDDNIGLMMKGLLAAANERSVPDALFDDISSRMDDGVLVIVSDMEETILRRQLASYIGGFRTREHALRRVNVTGGSMRTYLADEISVEGDAVVIEMSTRVPLTMENYVAAEVATLLFRNALIDELSHSGTDVDVTHTLRIYPEERYTARIAVSGIDKDRTGVQRTVRQVLSDLLDSDIDPKMLSAAKDFVKHRGSKQREYPSYWLHAIALRYLDGKDFTTGFEAKVDGLTTEEVMSFLELLNQ